MARSRNRRSLGGRAEQTGTLLATTNGPMTFQRTLMPRTTTDQALITGLSFAANHAVVSLLQETLQSVGLLLAGGAGRRGFDEGKWSRATIAVDAAAIAAGVGRAARVRATPERTADTCRHTRRRLPRGYDRSRRPAHRIAAGSARPARYRSTGVAVRRRARRDRPRGRWRAGAAPPSPRRRRTRGRERDLGREGPRDEPRGLGCHRGDLVRRTPPRRSRRTASRARCCPATNRCGARSVTSSRWRPSPPAPATRCTAASG